MTVVRYPAPEPSANRLPPPWRLCPTVDLDGQLAWSQRLDAFPAETRTAAQQLLKIIRQQTPSAFYSLIPFLRLRTMDRFQQEAVALGQLVQTDWRSILLANVSYDLLLTSYGCSTLAIPTATGPILVRNMDWQPEVELAAASVLIRTWDQLPDRPASLADQNLDPKPTKAAASTQKPNRSNTAQPRWISAGWPGGIGAVTAISNQGFAFALNAVIGTERPCWRGYPVLLLLRTILEDATSFADAVARIQRAKLLTAALITLVGTQNEERVVIERSPTRAVLRHPEAVGQVLIATNNYRAFCNSSRSITHPIDKLNQTACSRYDRLQQLFANHVPTAMPMEGQYLLGLTDPNVKQAITAQHILMQPSTGFAKLYAPRFSSDLKFNGL